MTYVGFIASAVLHVGGVFLLVTARAPEPLIPLGSDTPVAVNIISLDEYNAITSRAPARSTLAALRSQPAVPQAPVADENPVADTLEDTPPSEQPEPSVELAMRLPPVIADVLPEVDEPPAPDASPIEVFPTPKPLRLDADALQDRGVDPADLGPPEDVQVATAPPPAPEPPRGAFDAPVIDTTPDEPPKPAETEGEGEEAEPAPEPAPAPETSTEVAKAEDPAPLATPFPVPKPRGSLAVASDEDRAPAQVAAAPTPPPQLAPVPVPAPTPEPPAETASQLSEAELEEERLLMAALMEQMRANQPPSEAALRAAEDEARRKFAEGQKREAELAVLDDAERRKREAEDRARAEAERLAEAEALSRAQEFAEQQARAEREAAERALRAQREAEENRRRAQIEAQRLAQQEFERRQREEARLQQEARDLVARRQQLADLNANIAPEARASTVLNAPANNSLATGTSSLDRIFAAANVAATDASTGPSFGQGGNRGAGGASLTLDERQAVLNQLRRCWRVATFSTNARSQVVILRAQIRQNGFVNQATISVVSPNPIPADYQVAVQRAQTALRDRTCQPFALPANKFNAWRDIEIRFDPAQMVLQ